MNVRSSPNRDVPTTVVAVDGQPVTLLGQVPPASRGGRHIRKKLGIHIDRNGVWYYHGSPIQRKELICLFASVLRKDTEGGFWLVTPDEMGKIDVDDVPFIAVEMFVGHKNHEQIISFRTNLDEIVTLDIHHPLAVVHDPVNGHPLPYILLKDGLEAKLSRPVYYDVAVLASEYEIEGDIFLGVWSRGHFFPLGRLEDDK